MSLSLRVQSAAEIHRQEGPFFGLFFARTREAFHGAAQMRPRSARRHLASVWVAMCARRALRSALRLPRAPLLQRRPLVFRLSFLARFTV